MQYAYDLGGGTPVIKTVKLGAAVNAGAIAMIDATNAIGHVISNTTTSCADGLGVIVSAGTYSAAPAAGAEGTCDVVCNPFQVIRARVSGSSVTGAALTTANVFTQTAASTTVITSAAVPAYTVNKNSTIFCLTGANAGRSRIVTSHVDSVSVTVTVAFPVSVAVGDKLVVVPYEIGGVSVQTTATDFLEADGSVEIATGMNVAVCDVQVLDPNPSAPQVYVYFINADSVWNPID